MELEFQLTKDDWKEFNTSICKRIRKKRWIWPYSFYAVTIALLAFGLWAENMLFKGLALGAVLGSSIHGIYISRWSKGFVPKNPNGFFSPQKIKTSKDKCLITSAKTKIELQWGYLSFFTETENLFLLMFEDHMGYVIPKRAFKNEAQMEEFRKLCREKIPARS